MQYIHVMDNSYDTTNESGESRGGERSLSVKLNAGAAFFHAVQSVVVFSLVSWLNTQSNELGIFPLDKTVGIWHKKTLLNSSKTITGTNSMVSDDYFIENKKISSGYLDVRYVIAIFFALSAIFQAVGGYFVSGYWGSRLRFVEYSFSASIMIIGIGVEAGIQDIYTLEMMFVLTWATMIFGLLADVLSMTNATETEPLFEVFGIWTWMVPHVSGWITFLAAYAPILDNFIQSSSKSEISAPGFVNVIVFLQFFLFGCFGLVQTYSLVKKTYLSKGNRGFQFTRDAAILHETVEMVYVILSFVAKTLLCWLILSPILIGAIK
jgi:hypothetical protein